MAELGRFTRELRARLWKPSVDREVDEELSHHLALLERDFTAQGMTPGAARAAARARFGDVVGIGDACRDIGESRDLDRRRARWAEEAGQDLRHAVRQLRAAPRFALVATLTLAIGLGASTTIFGIASAVLLRPLPFRETARLVVAEELSPAGEPFSLSEPDFLDWRTRARRFTALAAFAERTPNLSGDAGPEQVRAAVATHELFGVLGVAPALGRTYTAEEDARGGDYRVAVISDALWRRRFGADRGVLARTVDLDGVRHRVIGVMPPGFDFPNRTDVWTPLVPVPQWPRGDRRVDAVVARLAPGATREQGRDELRDIARQLGTEYPETNGRWDARVR
ncbi:MAG: ABC transporter permease, partial [Gemmatirosa sp.]|nr:ABC transporter permease [Gemmatirosa sp.]